jgi:hypothetical protein
MILVNEWWHSVSYSEFLSRPSLWECGLCNGTGLPFTRGLNFSRPQPRSTTLWSNLYFIRNHWCWSIDKVGFHLSLRFITSDGSRNNCRRGFSSPSSSILSFSHSSSLNLYVRLKGGFIGFPVVGGLEPRPPHRWIRHCSSPLHISRYISSRTSELVYHVYRHLGIV